jgi:L-lactate dehydrogenase complex protein LldF
VTHLSSETFAANARAALDDKALGGALRRATDLFAERRATALSSVPDWEALRERGRAIKAEALAHLDRYLVQFEEKAKAAGARVHWADDAHGACELVLKLARERGAKRLVKSKSMTTEEIGLNAAFARAEGVEPVETDLGEWIIQLAGETPSHIIVPAIHKTKADVAQLFVDKLAIEPTQDVQELAATARRLLRKHFAEADLGVSGVNFGVAETGSILILENEGNARLTTTLPRVHVAVMGIEKVIPKFADLEVFLRLLPRSGTGQHLTSYQSILTGPDGPAREGPTELHIVLLDNGRSALLGEELTRQTLACIRCGACLNACPVYQAIGGHAYGSVYPGPIGAVLTPQLDGAEKSHALPFASSLCGACRDVCPVKIDIPALLLSLRARVVERARLPNTRAPETLPVRASERRTWRLWAWLMTHPRALGLALRFARVGQRWPSLARRLPPIAAWTSSRELPRIAARSFRERWAEERRP